jgi:hypothetical protein
MVLPLLPLIPAGIAALGTAGRFFNSPTGQRAVQGGIQAFRNLPTTLQGYINPLSQAVGGPQFAAKPLTSTSMALTALETPGLMVDAAKSMGVGSSEAEELSAADVEEMLEQEPSIDDLPLDAKEAKDKKEKKKIKRADAIKALTKLNPNFSDLSKERQEKQIKSYMNAQNLKKGGYVKKKRKRKPYKPSSFVKMKGRKKYI